MWSGHSCPLAGSAENLAGKSARATQPLYLFFFPLAVFAGFDFATGFFAGFGAGFAGLGAGLAAGVGFAGLDFSGAFAWGFAGAGAGGAATARGRNSHLPLLPFWVRAFPLRLRLRLALQRRL